MATIYISEDTLARLDKEIKKYNETHAETERSPFIDHLLDNYNGKKK
jgi:hypothetical protein